MSIDVGSHLKAVRTLYGLSQRELAKRAGVTNGTISLIEQNRVSPSISSLKKVLDGIPMSLAEFFTVDLRASPKVFYSRGEQTDLGDAKMRITVAATQFACAKDRVANLATAERMIRAAAARGANIILVQELFETPYFCKDHSSEHFALALPVAANPAVQRFCGLARELNVVLPVSFYERAGNTFYNSVALIDADATILGVYRKAHIPESPGYHEKFYFSPGDTGFKVWATRFGTIGVGICWDQWFPESARVMALSGAEILLYPTAIGTEPQDTTIDSRDHWQRAMQGHAAANILPVIASNRVGTERGERWTVTYYGSSFITDHTGAILEQAARTGEAILTATFDLEAIRRYRDAWGVFRDRRPDLYGPMLTLDGLTLR